MKNTFTLEQLELLLTDLLERIEKIEEVLKIKTENTKKNKTTIFIEPKDQHNFKLSEEGQQKIDEIVEAIKSEHGKRIGLKDAEGSDFPG